MFDKDSVTNDSELVRLLSQSQKLIETEFALTAVMSFELEFFLLKQNDQIEVTEKSLLEFCASIKEISVNHGIKLGNVSKEAGKLQYEVNLQHGSNLVKLVQDLSKIKEIITSVASSYDLRTSFAAKPYQDDDVGSGMHVHLSFSSKESQNIFQDKGENFYQIISALLYYLPASLLFFIKDESDFMRFNSKFKIAEQEVRYRCNTTNAPVNISWGINNRTTAIRIPDNHQEPQSIRIEHRVPSSNANPYFVLIAILLGAYLGLKKKLAIPERIWGNAFDKQYKLDPLPLNMAEAKKYFYNSDLHKLLNNL